MKTLSKFETGLARSLSLDSAPWATLFTTLILGPLAWSSGEADAAPAALHLNGVTALAFAPDQKQFAVSEPCGRLTIRRRRDGAIVWTAYHCRLGVLSFSGDSSLIASTGESRTGEATIKLWAAITGAAVLIVTNPIAPPRQVLISPDKHLLLAAFEGGGVACWEISCGRLRWHRLHVNPAGSLTFTPGGTMIQSTARGQPMTLLNVHDGSTVHEFVPDG